MTIELYSLATPNGQKIGIALEELGLAYGATRIDLSKNEQKTAWFLSLNPNGKIPVIVDPDGPDGQSLVLYESNTILLYLADKAGALIPSCDGGRLEVIKWLFWQASTQGANFGKFGHFFKQQHKYSPSVINYLTDEVAKVFSVLDQQLANHTYVAGEHFSIADIAILPWIDALEWGYHSHEYLNIAQYTHVLRWFNQCLNRQALQRGRAVTPYWLDSP